MPEPLNNEQIVDESGWLIERHILGSLHYWSGDALDDKSGRSWTEDSTKAIRFARRKDGIYVLSRLLNGVGAVNEHVWSYPIPES